MLVGTLGSVDARALVLIDSACSLPSRTSGSADASGAKKKSFEPPITLVIASGVPLYGMWTASMPACMRKISAFMCVALPTPALAKFRLPGFALAAATRSACVFQPLAGFTTSTFGMAASVVMPVRSRSVS